MSNANRPFPCSMCAQSSNTQANLNEHIRYCHIGTSCLFPGCHVGTESESLLRTHISQVHGNVPSVEGIYACSWPQCPKTFLNQNCVNRCLYFHTYDQLHSDIQVHRGITALPALLNQVTQISTDLVGVDTRLNGIDTRLNGIDTRLNGIETRLNALNTNVDARTTSILTSLAEMQTMLQDFIANANRGNGDEKNEEEEGEEEEEVSGRAAKRSRT